MPGLAGRIGSELRVSASFQIFALKMLLHSAGVYLRGIFSAGTYVSEGGGYFLESVPL